jgi:hypothetical protein
VSPPQRRGIPRFTPTAPGPKLANVNRIAPFRCLPACVALSLLFARVLLASPAYQQAPPQTDAKAPEVPAQIELLETHIRFEANGDSRKEVHTRVRINNELGVRQFSRLTFDYNRSFQQIEIPLVHITHASGGTADILPGAISDQPNPAVASAPAYEDVRVKSVRILGLSPSDVLEYSVVTTTAHGPFAPNFYLSHDFADETVVTQEVFEIDLPASKPIKPATSPAAQVYETQESGEGASARVVYRWRRSSPSKTGDTKEVSAHEEKATPALSPLSDIAVTSMVWTDVPAAIQKSFRVITTPSPETKAKAEELTHSATTPEEKLRVLYDFVTRKISTVDLPLGTTGFRLRSTAEILSSGTGIPEEKCLLLSSLAWAVGIQTTPALVLPTNRSLSGAAIPSVLTDVVVVARLPKGPVWLDPSVEVAPFAMVPSSIRGKPALLLRPSNDAQFYEKVSNTLPFAAVQRVNVDATLTEDGTLNAKVHYTLRGDNELLLRVAFHQSPREKWKDVAQLLALSDGFRGKILSASASDPSATKQPLTIDYEITQPKFVDWSKRPVRIPALLPALGVPDPPAKSESGASAPIELGTPLDVDTKLTLHLPAGASALSPTGTSVERDYATFVSHYAAEGNVVFASRHINFILREVSATRTVDYNAFLHAVQTDQSQLFTLNPAIAPQPAASKP